MLSLSQLDAWDLIFSINDDIKITEGELANFKLPPTIPVCREEGKGLRKKRGRERGGGGGGDD